MTQQIQPKMIASLAGKLALREITLAAILYMEAKFNDIDNLMTGGDDDQAIIREIIRKWKNRTQGTPQQLANILNVATTIDKEEIKTTLGVTNLGTIKDKATPTGDKIEEWELARLAMNSKANVMENIAAECEALSDAQIANIKSGKKGERDYQSFEILKRWCAKDPNNNRWKLKEMLREAGEDSHALLGELPGNFDSADHRGVDQGTSLKLAKESKAEPHDKPTDQMPGPSAEQSDPATDLKIFSKVYPMDVKLPGYILIFNNQKFEGGENREGTETDVAGLKSVFSNLGFKVVVADDLSAKDMKTRLKAFVKKDTFKSEDAKTFSKEKIEAFLKDIKHSETIKNITKRGKILDKLRTKALTQVGDKLTKEDFEQEREILQSKLSLIEEVRKTIDKPMTPEQKARFEKEFDKDDNKTLEKLMIEEQQLEYKEIEAFLNETKGKDDESISFKETGCCIVVFLSHGDDGYLFDKHWEQIDIDELIDEFTSDNCEHLGGKPKAFLIQACRGEGDDWRKDSGPNDKFVKDYIIKEDEAIPRGADMMVGYATTTGLASYRHKYEGTVFIKHFCNVVKTCANEMDVLAMTTKINEQVADEEVQIEGKPVRQMSEFRHSLRKTWKLPAKDNKD